MKGILAFFLERNSSSTMTRIFIINYIKTLFLVEDYSIIFRVFLIL